MGGESFQVVVLGVVSVVTPLGYMFVGAGITLFVSLSVSLIADRATFDTFLGCLLGWLVLPAFWVAKLLVSCGPQSQSLSPQALERWAGRKRVGSGRAFVFSYGWHGVIFVRGMRNNG